MLESNLFISSTNSINRKSMPCDGYLLGSEDVIIYSIFLPDFINLKSELAMFLNSDEINRAKRFYKEIDKDRFIIYRSMLKFIVAAYTKLDVTKIHFDYHSNKKPYLSSHPWLCFNISHSEDFAVIAISLNKVGIDIEYSAKDFAFNNLLPDIFNNNEVLAIENAVNKKDVFYHSWTRKEALVKGLGKGIDDDFKNIPSLDGHHRVDTTILKNAEKWQVTSFELADNYVGAIAFEGSTTNAKNLIWHAIPQHDESINSDGCFKKQGS